MTVPWSRLEGRPPADQTAPRSGVGAAHLLTHTDNTIVGDPTQGGGRGHGNIYLYLLDCKDDVIKVYF